MTTATRENRAQKALRHHQLRARLREGLEWLGRDDQDPRGVIDQFGIYTDSGPIHVFLAPSSTRLTVLSFSVSEWIDDPAALSGRRLFHLREDERSAIDEAVRSTGFEVAEKWAHGHGGESYAVSNPVAPSVVRLYSNYAGLTDQSAGRALVKTPRYWTN